MKSGGAFLFSAGGDLWKKNKAISAEILEKLRFGTVEAKNARGVKSRIFQKYIDKRSNKMEKIGQFCLLCAEKCSELNNENLS